ncbi:MAG: hypothetical protein HKL99_16805 [Burkholderiales bacterium]|nr:hypothetical protein [Burkholderiales bacterium]
MRALESRLLRLEQRHQPRTARDATDAELLRTLGLPDMRAFIRLANSVDRKEPEPPADCNDAERDAWFYLRDMLHFDKLPL